MNTKPIPAIVMLTAGFAMCVISIANGYSLSFLIRALFVVLICFYLLGWVIRIVLDVSFRKTKTETDMTADDLGFAEGEIIMDEELEESES